MDFVWSRARTIGDGFVIGIDFGTSNSSAAVWFSEENSVQVIENLSRLELTPSEVSFTSEDFIPKIHRQIVSSADQGTCVASSISGAKLLLGKKNSNDEDVSISCYNDLGQKKDISVVDICSYIIKEVYDYSKQYIEKNFETLKQAGKTDRKIQTSNIAAVVLGIPVSFTTAQVNALKRAAIKAGIQQVS